MQRSANKESAVTRAGADEVSLVAGRQLVVFIGDLDSASQQKAAAEMSLYSFAAMPAIAKCGPSWTFYSGGQPLATECCSWRGSRLVVGYRGMCNRRR